MLYFLAAIGFAFSTQHPVYVALSCAMSSAYLVYLRGWRSFVRTMGTCVPLVVFVGLLNSLFNAAGVTILWQWGPFCVCVEGVCYGVAMGGMLIAVLLWFACYNEVMTEDKFIYLFGRRLPTASLLVTMISRWVPRMVSRGRSIYDSQEVLIGGCDRSRRGRLKRGVRMATVLVGLGMEDSIQTADSMSARGYGAAKRTSYARFRWHARERVVLVVLCALIAVNATLLVVDAGAVRVLPARVGRRAFVGLCDVHPHARHAVLGGVRATRKALAQQLVLQTNAHANRYPLTRMKWRATQHVRICA